MSEASLTDRCKRHVGTLRKQGIPIKCLKIHGGAYQERGTPDMHITMFGRSLWIEFKTKTGKTTKLQDKRLSEWSDAGATVAVIRTFDQFKEILSGLANSLS